MASLGEVFQSHEGGAFLCARKYSSQRTEWRRPRDAGVLRRKKAWGRWPRRGARSRPRSHPCAASQGASAGRRRPKPPRATWRRSRRPSRTGLRTRPTSRSPRINDDGLPAAGRRCPRDAAGRGPGRSFAHRDLLRADRDRRSSPGEAPDRPGAVNRVGILAAGFIEVRGPGASLRESARLPAAGICAGSASTFHRVLEEKLQLEECRTPARYRHWRSPELVVTTLGQELRHH